MSRLRNIIHLVEYGLRAILMVLALPYLPRLCRRTPRIAGKLIRSIRLRPCLWDRERISCKVIWLALAVRSYSNPAILAIRPLP